jgi:aryl-alcohol dehydrogenase-like predicted oxidoreductase
MEAYAVARQYNLIPPTMEQPQYNMFTRYRVEVEYNRLYNPDTIGLGTTIWSPLASGLLTGKYNDVVPNDTRINLPGYEWLKARFESPEGQAQLVKVRDLAKIAGDLGTTLPKLALAWCAKNPNVSTVITGASKAAQVKENFGALELMPQLTDEVMTAIDNVLGNKETRLHGSSE